MTCDGKAIISQENHLLKPQSSSLTKKDSKLCMYIHYRALNEVTINKNNLRPHIDDLFDRLAGTKYLNCIDYQFGIVDEDVEKIVCRTNYGSYEREWMIFDRLHS